MVKIDIYLKNDPQPLQGLEYESQPDDMVRLSGQKSPSGVTSHTYYIPKANIQYIEAQEAE